MVGLSNSDVDGENGMYYRKDEYMYLVSRKGSYRLGHSFLSNRCHWGGNRQVWLDQVLTLLSSEESPVLADILAVDLSLLAENHYRWPSGGAISGSHVADWPRKMLQVELLTRDEEWQAGNVLQLSNSQLKW